MHSTLDTLITMSGAVRDARGYTIHLPIRAVRVSCWDALDAASELAMLLAPGTKLRVETNGVRWETPITRDLQLAIAKRLDRERTARLRAEAEVLALSFEEAAQ